MNMLRIFDKISYIVTMLETVIYDLRIFLLFYFIMIGLFAQVFNVLGLGNKEINDYPVRKNNFAEMFRYREE